MRYCTRLSNRSEKTDQTRLQGVQVCLFALQMLMVQSVVADINRRTGESECQYYKDRLLYTEDGQKDELIDRSRTLSCHGELKNNRGLVSRFQPPMLF